MGYVGRYFGYGYYMNEALQRRLSQLESLIGVQRNCIPPTNEGQHGTYMIGLLNGMIIGHSCFTDDKPEFKSCAWPLTRAKIRHKSYRKRK